MTLPLTRNSICKNIEIHKQNHSCAILAKIQYGDTVTSGSHFVRMPNHSTLNSHPTMDSYKIEDSFVYAISLGSPITQIPLSRFTILDDLKKYELILSGLLVIRTKWQVSGPPPNRMIIHFLLE